MLERLTAADCDAWVGVTFEVPGLQTPIALLLESVTAVGAPSDQPARQSFSLIFRGPASPLLPQSIYRLESDVAEAVEIFLVPIGQDASSATYEAIFN